MSETRSVKISAVITPALAERLDTFAEEGHWPRSTAVAVLIERGLEASKPLLTVTGTIARGMYCTHGGPIHDASCFTPPKEES